MRHRGLRPCRRGRRCGISTGPASPRRIFRALAIRAPMPEVLSGGAVEDDDAAVAVAVGDEDLVVGRIDPDFGGPAHERRVVAAAGLVVLPDDERHLPGAGELHGEVALARVRPHEAIVIDEHAVNRAPVAVGSARVPRLHELALRIPLRDAATIRRPDVSARVGEDADHLPPRPVLRQDGPFRIDLEHGHAVQCRDRLRNGSLRLRAGGDRRKREHHDRGHRRSIESSHHRWLLNRDVAASLIATGKFCRAILSVPSTPITGPEIHAATRRHHSRSSGRSRGRAIAHVRRRTPST